MSSRKPGSRHLASIALTLLALLAAATASAQGPFSLAGIGADVRSSDARIDGRGGWGLAESDTLIPSFHNLAGLPGLRKVAIVVSGYGERVASVDDTATRTTNRVRTPTLRAAVPFAEGRLIASAGFEGLRGTQFDTQRETFVLLPDPADPLGPDVPFDAREFFVREGTQFQVPLGLSWRASSRVSLGASLNLVGGVIRERVNLIFEEPVTSDGNLYFLTSAETLEDQLSGLSTTWSVLVDPMPGLAVGATYTTAHHLDVTRTRDMQGIPGDEITEYGVGMPATWGAGAALRLSERWRFGAELESQPYSRLTAGAGWADHMTDAWRLGVGFDRAEDFVRRAGRRNLPLRVGYSLRTWPYLVGGEEIREHRVSAGTGFSFRDRSGHLDLAVSHAWVGAADKNGIEDRVWRFTVSLAGLEQWW